MNEIGTIILQAQLMRVLECDNLKCFDVEIDNEDNYIVKPHFANYDNSVFVGDIYNRNVSNVTVCFNSSDAAYSVLGGIEKTRNHDLLTMSEIDDLTVDYTKFMLNYGEVIAVSITNQVFISYNCNYLEYERLMNNSYDKKNEKKLKKKLF